MKTEYPEKYKLGELDLIYNKFPKKEKETINNFISFCSTTNAERKLGDIRRSLIQFRDVTEKSFDKLQNKDLISYISLLNQSDRKKWTKRGIKAYLKSFLKWKFKDWSSKFDNLRYIKLEKAFNEERINEGTILKEKDIETVMDKETNFIKKTFFITLFESGCRPQELRNLKWDKINFNTEGDISELNLFSRKTLRSRVVFVKQATYYLSKLLEESDSEFCFPALRNKEKPISKSTASQWIKAIGKDTLGKDIFPYLLRHSRATQLYKTIPSKVAKRFLGHSKDMGDFYEHMNSTDIKDSLLKSVYNLKDKLTTNERTSFEIRIKALEERMAEVTNLKLEKLNSPERLEVDEKGGFSIIKNASQLRG